MKKIFLTIVFATIALTARSQHFYPATQAELEKLIINLDHAAFECFNTCNLETFRNYFTESLEFYHDKGGIMLGVEAFLKTTQTNICGDGSKKIRREPVPGTFKVYPMEGYGALLQGDHLFYITENGRERLTGRAKFTHLWLLENGQWKMARIFSYDHKPAE